MKDFADYYVGCKTSQVYGLNDRQRAGNLRNVCHPRAMVIAQSHGSSAFKHAILVAPSGSLKVIEASLFEHALSRRSRR
ncbi:MAG: hypothetical protein CMK43_11630 [Porticoccaceae bacterium]|nr:hypothetical protein [Porticoccaceae bacterium]